MTQIMIQYFDGCPNWQVASQRIRTAIGTRDDVSIDYQPVETPEDAQRLRFAGSPTILIDGIDPFAAPHQPIGLTCRVYQTPHGPAGSPTVDQLIHALNASSTPPNSQG
ncbi:MAG: thioredoxin family protein [Pseudonocardiales bacterium]